MARFWLISALFCLGAAAPAQPAPTPPVPWPVEWFVEWRANAPAGTIAAAGIEAQLEHGRCGGTRPVSEGCGAGDSYARILARAPGLTPLRLEGDPGLDSFIAIGRLGASRRAAVILVSDGGGSGGCVAIDIAMPRPGGWDAVRLHPPESTSTRTPFCGIEPAQLAWPRDRIGDGRADFVLPDDRFACRFTSCASSWLPRRILAFDGLAGVDVSRHPVFAPLFRADMVKARKACEHRLDEPQGACAGYAADAARLGQLQSALAVVERQVARGCRVRISGPCPDSNRIPPGFVAELTRFLRAAGY